MSRTSWIGGKSCCLLNGFFRRAGETRDISRRWGISEAPAIADDRQTHFRAIKAYLASLLSQPQRKVQVFANAGDL